MPDVNIKTLIYRLTQPPGMKAGKVANKSNAYWIFNVLDPSIAIPQEVKVADVSYAQGVINWDVLASRDLSGAWIRAGQGGWSDTQFTANWTNAKGKLARGSYWYYDSRYEPKAQAARWYNLVKADVGEMGMLADYEEKYGGTYASKDSFYVFKEEVGMLSGLPLEKMPNYTGYYFWGERVGNDSRFKKYPLHLAWYTTNQTVVKVPLPWTEDDLLFWQYTSSGDGYYYGTQNSRIDLNYYNGTQTEFNNRYGVQPPTGGTMKYTATALADGTRLRSDHNVNNTYIGSYPKGTLFHGDVLYVAPDNSTPNQLQGDTWLQVSQVGATAKSGWVAVTHLGNPICSLAENNPPAGDEIVIDVTGTAKISINGVQVYP